MSLTIDRDAMLGRIDHMIGYFLVQIHVEQYFFYFVVSIFFDSLVFGSAYVDLE